jgi:hypothetical protein
MCELDNFKSTLMGRSPSMKTIKDVIKLSPLDYFPLGILTFKRINNSIFQYFDKKVATFMP